MNKRGLHKDKSAQFYLLAAIVIVAIIIGLAGVMNYSKKKSDTKIIDLGEELGIEGARVLEYGVYNPGEDKIEDFAAKYDSYAGQDKNLFFIFGDSDGAYVLTYDEVIIGHIGFQESGMDLEESVGEKIELDIVDGKVIVPILDPETQEVTNYEFELNPGENFYFIVSQELASGEEHVVTG